MGAINNCLIVEKLDRVMFQVATSMGPIREYAKPLGSTTCYAAPLVLR